MDTNIKDQIIEAGAAAVEAENKRLAPILRARSRSGSRQPRMEAPRAEDFFASTLRWVVDPEANAPEYSLDSRKRDQWLRRFWPKEPHLAGVLNSVQLIDSNRGWTLVGGRNQVRRFTTILHEVENGAGWRQFIRLQSQAFRTSDLGAVTEVGTEGEGGPLRSLFYVDPARCRLTGNVDQPLLYTPPRAKEQAWLPGDFFRMVSMPSTDETLHQLGYCAISRAVELARTMIAVYGHDHEMLLSKAPRGLLLLKGISESQWVQAMEARDVDLAANEQKYYGAVAVLAGSGLEDVDAKLIALSQLPKDFNRQQFMELLMYAYALIFGYAPEEFWPVRGGSLGRGTEAELQHTRATSKGGLDFANLLQENLQRLLPETLQFEFDERDTQGEMLEAEARMAELNVIKAMYEAGLQAGSPLITRDEARSMMATAHLIPEDWTLPEEDVTVDDEDAAPDGGEDRRRALSRYRDLAPVRRAAEIFPEDPVVRYSWPTGRMETLWARAGMILEADRAVFPVKRTARRQTVQRADDGEVLYDQDGVKITEGDVTRAVDQGRKRLGTEFGEILSAEVDDGSAD